VKQEQVVRDNEIFTTMDAFPVVEVPRDKDGFIQSFTIDDEENYLQFFNKFGFVVIDNVLEKNEIDTTILEVWETLEKAEKIVNRNDSNTWGFYSPVGILGDLPCSSKQAWRNRQNPKLYRAFSTIMNTKELWVSIDRFGIMRPTENVPIGKLKEEKIRKDVKDSNGLECKSMKDWKTVPLWLHWDLNPWIWTTGEGNDYDFGDDSVFNFIVENNGSKNDGRLKLQGLINLIDSTENEGGFCTVPGYFQYLNSYAKITKDSLYAERKKKTFDFVNVFPDDKMNDQYVKITSRAGSLII